MSDLPWIGAEQAPDALPSPDRAMRDPNGLLAAGGSLRPDWLLTAYRRGAFPWFEAGQPILWWSPDPRAVLIPTDFKVSRSLRRSIAKGLFAVTADQDFAGVIGGCAQPRAGSSSTWITMQMQQAFIRLHALGYAHSFEAWHKDQLVGGLYGIAIGGVFFGESMFSSVSDASKIALAGAIEFFVANGIQIIDCQVRSAHLESLGASLMRRREFLQRIETLCALSDEPGSWSTAFAARQVAAVRQHPTNDGREDCGV